MTNNFHKLLYGVLIVVIIGLIIGLSHQKMQRTLYEKELGEIHAEQYIGLVLYFYDSEKVYEKWLNDRVIHVTDAYRIKAWSSNIAIENLIEDYNAINRESLQENFISDFIMDQYFFLHKFLSKKENENRIISLDALSVSEIEELKTYSQLTIQIVEKLHGYYPEMAEGHLTSTSIVKKDETFWKDTTWPNVIVELERLLKTERQTTINHNEN